MGPTIPDAYFAVFHTETGQFLTHYTTPLIISNEMVYWSYLTYILLKLRFV